MQQVLNPSGLGGVSAEYRALEHSKLTQEFDFVPLILQNPHRGLSIKDIKFYYQKIKECNPDIVQVRGAAIDGLNAEIAVKLVGKPKLLLCVHGMYSDLVYINAIKRFIHKNCIERIAFALSDGISCVYKGAENRKIFKKYSNKMLGYVYNRMPDYGSIDLLQVKRTFREKFLIPQDAIVGVYCGRVTKEKGLTYLLDAFKKMKSYWDNNLFFIIVGAGDYLNEFKKECEKDLTLFNRIVFTGELKDVVIPLASSDFFIQPSLHENHSIALLESMAMKLPTIATDVGGNPEIISDGITGIIIEPANSKMLMDAILSMCDNSKRANFKKNIENYDFSKFSDDRIDESLKKVYEEILNK